MSRLSCERKFMLIVTEAATLRLAEKLTGKNAADDVAMRFERRDGGWQLRLDTPAPDDVAIEHAGRTVLVLAPDAAQRLSGRTLDAQDTPAGSRLYFR